MVLGVVVCWVWGDGWVGGERAWPLWSAFLMRIPTPAACAAAAACASCCWDWLMVSMSRSAPCRIASSAAWTVLVLMPMALVSPCARASASAWSVPCCVRMWRSFSLAWMSVYSVCVVLRLVRLCLSDGITVSGLKLCVLLPLPSGVSVNCSPIFVPMTQWFRLPNQLCLCMSCPIRCSDWP